MTMQPLKNADHISEWKAGERLSAARLNQMQAMMKHLTDQVRQLQEKIEVLAPLVLGELVDDVEPGAAGVSTDKDVDRIWYDSTQLPSDPWTADTNQRRTRVTDIHEGIFLAGEQHILYFHSPSGKLVPWPCVQLHIAKLTAALTGGAGNTSTAKIWYVTGGSEAATTLTDVTVYSWGGSSGSNGDEVLVFQHRQSKRWYVATNEAGADTCKVKVASADTCDWLEEQYTPFFHGQTRRWGLGVNEFSVGEDFPISMETVKQTTTAHHQGEGDATEMIMNFLDGSQIRGFKAGQPQVLGKDDGGQLWYDVKLCQGVV